MKYKLKKKVLKPAQVRGKKVRFVKYVWSDPSKTKSVVAKTKTKRGVVQFVGKTKKGALKYVRKYDFL